MRPGRQQLCLALKVGLDMLSGVAPTNPPVQQAAVKLLHAPKLIRAVHHKRTLLLLATACRKPQEPPRRRPCHEEQVHGRGGLGSAPQVLAALELLAQNGADDPVLSLFACKLRELDFARWS